MEVEERIGARYRPPALRALASGGDPSNEPPPSSTTPGDTSALSPTSFPSNFRRARAGTLPSNVQLAAQRFAAASGSLSSLSSAAPSTESFTEQLQRPQGLGTAIAPAPVRPGLRHSASVASSAASSALTERNSRLRSGSLTLPTGGLSNAFGPSIFSSSWLSSRNNNGLPILDDLHSVASMESGTDDFDVHTLDYLGLEDPLRPPPAATITELRTQAQAAIAGNLANPSSRLRATTVSHPYRLGASAGASLLSTPNAEEEELYNQELYHSQGLDQYDDAGQNSNYLSAGIVARGFKNSDHLGAGLGSRPRAISVGNLDDPSRAIHRRTAGAEIPQASPYATDLSSMGLGSGTITPSGILRSGELNTRGGAGASVHFPSGDMATSRASPYLAAPNAQGRSVSPKNADNAATQMQTPTRSLWIGNLDSSVTSEQLIHVFAPYGAIESLRLLPEKASENISSVSLTSDVCDVGVRLRQLR